METLVFDKQPIKRAKPYHQSVCNVIEAISVLAKDTFDINYAHLCDKVSGKYGCVLGCQPISTHVLFGYLFTGISVCNCKWLTPWRDICFGN